MKKLLFLVAFCCSGSVFAVWNISTTASSAICPVAIAENSCALFLEAEALTSCGASYTFGNCSTDPVVVGTTINIWDRASGADLGARTITSVVQTCGVGTHKDTSTNTCVDDVTIAVASCMPSIRTISPCPSGYAPTNAIPAGSGPPIPFISDFDGLPIQDMIYAVGVALCGLLGITVGVKLV